MKTIRVGDENWKRLSRIKTEYGLKSMDKVVEKLLNKAGLSE